MMMKGIRQDEVVNIMEYKFTTDNFDAEVMNSDIPVLIDFYADWCGPCQMMGPVVKELASEYDGKIKIGKVNVDQQPELASKYGVRSIPYFAFIKDGILCDDITGSVPKSRLVSKLEAMV
ncbi:thioredoxin [Anaerovibrio sp. RM50]|uniref:thioredoxin n=1 Tax=Anaerovibrio sp. RM50 TaxID=1200557 RepID=UPI0018DE9537|nr:thioredoxin [Anaerovibrio sp. RM50]